MQPIKKIDVYEVLANLDLICKSSKFTFEEHQYLQDGLKEISDKLNEQKDMKAAMQAEESK